jgi:flavodoxin
MKNLLLTVIAMLGISVPSTQAKDLVAYFSAQGNTKAVAERIAELTGADIYRIEAAEPYAANPYDDSDRIQNEAYNDLRPAVANPPSQEWINQYDRIYIGSPCWWHQPAMVVCTFLETYDLSNHVIIPFFTYGATTYLNESMQKIYKCTPNSVHIPETLPEDLDADDITRPGRPDDGIDMPGNARGVEGWLTRLGLLGNSGIADIDYDSSDNIRIYSAGGEIHIELDENISSNTVEIYNVNGSLVQRMSGRKNYSITAPAKSVYLLSMVYGPDNRRVNKKFVL